MLTWEDCLGLSRIDAEVIAAIAEHEHMPELVALELANYLCESEDGVPRIKRMIIEDIDAALDRGDETHAAHLLETLHHFVAFAREERL